MRYLKKKTPHHYDCGDNNDGRLIIREATNQPSNQPTNQWRRQWKW